MGAGSGSGAGVIVRVWPRRNVDSGVLDILGERFLFAGDLAGESSSISTDHGVICWPIWTLAGGGLDGRAGGAKFLRDWA